MASTPSIYNYTVGKGIASFKKVGAATWHDLGNVTAFEFTPKVNTLDHFSSREGLKKKDRSIVISSEGELKITMDEWVAENLQLALMANIDVDSSGRQVLDILQLSSVAGEVKFVGNNTVGPKFTWLFNNVSFVPSSAVSPLSDEWGEFDVTGQVLADEAGKFGTVTRTGGDADDPSSS